MRAADTQLGTGYRCRPTARAPTTFGMTPPHTGHAWRGALLLLTAGLAGIATAAPAAAASPAGATTVSRSGSVLTVTGGATANVIEVGFRKGNGFLGTWLVTDSAAPLAAGPGCTAGGTQVSCPGDGLSDRVSIDAGDGDDRVTYTFGLPSTVVGGAGADTLSGGFGPDTMNGGVGADQITGGAGNDTIRGSGENDTLDGGPGNDDITGEGLDDTITGGPGSDTLSGEKGNDNIRGGPGDDGMTGASGSDTLIGDDGSDSADGGPISGTDGGVDTCDAETEIRCEQ